MRKEINEIKNQEELEEKFVNALVCGTPDEVRKVLKQGYKFNPEEKMRLIMWHCNDVEHVKILKEMGYDFKDDEKCLEEFTKHAALKPDIAQYMIDNGAVVSWKAIQNCANRYDLDVLKLLVDNKKDFYPI